MEQALIGLAALIVGVAAGFAVRARVGAARIGSAEREAARILADAEGRAEAQVKEARITAREELLQQRAEQERELGDRRADLAKSEERVIAREESVATRLEEVARRDQSIADRETHARQMQEELKAAKDQQLAELERVSSMTAAQARETLLAQVEERSRHDHVGRHRAREPNDAQLLALAPGHGGHLRPGSSHSFNLRPAATAGSSPA